MPTPPPPQATRCCNISKAVDAASPLQARGCACRKSGPVLFAAGVLDGRSACMEEGQCN